LFAHSHCCGEESYFDSTSCDTYALLIALTFFPLSYFTIFMVVVSMLIRVALIKGQQLGEIKTKSLT